MTINIPDNVAPEFFRFLECAVTVPDWLDRESCTPEELKAIEFIEQLYEAHKHLAYPV